MSQTPRIGLLIPTHNHARTIAETIESCINETFRDLEIVVFDEEINSPRGTSSTVTPAT